MQKKKTQKPLFQQIRDEYQAEMKRLKRKKFLLKARLMLTVILPIFIVLLSVKVIKTFVRIKVRSIFAKPEEKPAQKAPEAAEPSVPIPVKMTSVEKEIIKPVPAEGPAESQD